MYASKDVGFRKLGFPGFHDLFSFSTTLSFIVCMCVYVCVCMYVRVYVCVYKYAYLMCVRVCTYVVFNSTILPDPNPDPDSDPDPKRPSSYTQWRVIP